MSSVWETLSAINVSEHTEKKGNFSYLSWAWAWGTLKSLYPNAEVHKEYFNQGEFSVPYTRDIEGYAFVQVTIKVDDITLTETMPVLNHTNKPIQNPNSFEVNTSLQRCMAKAIAMCGLGHYIYAGEDLPPEQPVEAYSADTVKLFAATIQEAMIADDFVAIGRASIDNQDLFELANNGTRGKKTGYFSSAEKGKFSDYNKRYLEFIGDFVTQLEAAENDPDGLQELLAELDDPTDKRLVWGKLGNSTKQVIRMRDAA